VRKELTKFAFWNNVLANVLFQNRVSSTADPEASCTSDN
jgi:hypothetical protein